MHNMIKGMRRMHHMIKKKSVCSIHTPYDLKKVCVVCTILLKGMCSMHHMINKYVQYTPYD